MKIAQMAYQLPLSRRTWLATTTLAGTAAFAAPQFSFGQERVKTVPSVRDRAKLWNREERPFNAEAYLPDLIHGSVTPLEHFFIRTNGDIPQIDIDAYQLKVTSMGGAATTFSIRELTRRFDTHEVAATLTCAGNRRGEFAAIKKASGLQWGAGAIGHAVWQGVALRDVLAAAGVPEGTKHVWFDALDTIVHKDGSKGTFGGSLPLERIRQQERPVILATHMNGLPLTAEHGYPLRVVAPGMIGARSVKWLGTITFADRPSPNPFVDQSYKLVQSDNAAEASKTDPIYEYTVNSAICLPDPSAKLPAGKTRIVGYALPAGTPGARVKDVAITVDDKAPVVAKLLNEPQPYGWVVWSAIVDLTPGKHQLSVRATDSHGNEQPATAQWNYRGYQYNAPHRIEVEAA
jgi:sulfite oxidase